ncbi:hypothetical protein PVAG01_00324 [Phlyctema vagabunda]|uniref:Altered inheritance of mitochondria protein 6 n=1 Tax=Phlyctema vagabunda TaxID=108571 RepID=A0ABR4PTX5_9HELO
MSRIGPRSSSLEAFLEYDETSLSPLSTFSDRASLEKPESDGLVNQHGIGREGQRAQNRHWWAMGKSQQPYQDAESGTTQAPGVLAGLRPTTARQRRTRSYFNFLVFGGISGCTIVLFLLSMNIMLGVATMFWAEDIDQVLAGWGRPGTGTEGLAWYPTDFTRDIVPIPCHSHNDYWRKVPLFSALRAGCTGVEADVWLFDEDLYVGHNTASLTRNRTFQSLYVLPLVKILEGQNTETDFYNGSSHGVFDTDPGKPLTLLVDVKTSGAETWPWVLEQLEPLRERGWLSHVVNGTLYTRQITVVGTGNTPFDVLTANTTYRDAFFDAPLNDMLEAKDKDSPELDGSGREEDDLEESSKEVSQTRQDVGQGQSGVTADTKFDPSNSYYASVSFNQAVGQIWRGRLSQRQMKIIRGQIRGAHRRGLKARYWDLPAWPIGLRNHVWDVLVKEGVDMLNVDDLRAASKQVW